MGRTGKALRRAKKLSKKRALKAANRAMFQERAKLGQNKLNKRARASNKKNKKRMSRYHSATNCGNVGCKKCSQR